MSSLTPVTRKRLQNAYLLLDQTALLLQRCQRNIRGCLLLLCLEPLCCDLTLLGGGSLLGTVSMCV
jgi:hypothetical protein